MPDISELRESKFLKKEDVGSGALLTVTGCRQYNMAQEGEAEELKWCLEFKETDKPFRVNTTNGQLIAAFIGTTRMEDWTGHQIVLYTEPTVMMHGKVVGGIRCRAPRNRPAASAPAAAQAPRPNPQQQRPPAAAPAARPPQTGPPAGPCDENGVPLGEALPGEEDDTQVPF